MFQTHLKIAWRHLLRRRFHSFINLSGLTVGIATCMLIGLYIHHEISYDRHHPHKDLIYRVLSRGTFLGESRGVYHNPPLAQLAVNSFPEVQQAFRIRSMGSQLLRTEDNEQNHYEEKFIYADQAILEMLDMPLIYGDVSDALRQPFSVVITAEKAAKYFEKENPVGKIIFLNNNLDQPFTITGVLKPIPYSSHLDFDFYVAMNSLEESQSGSWNISSYPTYIQIAPNTDPKTVETQLQNIALLHKKNLVVEHNYHFTLQPISAIYLHSNDVRFYGYMPKGNLQYIRLFGAIAVFILLIAIVNFVNLSTARSAERAREVGIRKVLGSFRKHIVAQFLIESILLSLTAAVFAGALTITVFPYFELLLGKELTLLIETWKLWIVVLATGIGIGLCAGIYPAIHFSSFLPVKVLKGRMLTVGGSSRLRSGLVVFQFAVSAMLIIATLIVHQQMNYIQQKKLGFNKEQVLILEDTYMLGSQRVVFKQELQNLTDVNHVSMSSFVPVSGYRSSGSTFTHPDSVIGSEEVELRRWYVDEDYLATLGMNLLKGRNFSSNPSLDSNAIILNQTAVEMLGYDDPIGKQLEINQVFTVIGVVEDFHFRSFKEPIKGLAFHRGSYSDATTTLIKIQTDNISSTLSKIQSHWETFAPQQPLRYNFLDERFDEMYHTEKRTGTFFTIASLLAIFVACLGLFALASYMAEQRTKEISIRKILGATVGNIFRLLTQDLVRLAVIAFILSVPLAGLLMQEWLENFAYRIDLNWEVFLIGGITSILIALITISYQALRAAYTNPAENLRNE